MRDLKLLKHTKLLFGFWFFLLAPAGRCSGCVIMTGGRRDKEEGPPWQRQRERFSGGCVAFIRRAADMSEPVAATR